MRRAAEAGLVLCLIGGVVLLVMFGPGALPILTFHYERNLSADAEGHFSLDVTGFENCQLEISIRDDSELLYDVNLELYRHGVEGTDFEVTYDETGNQPSLAVRAYNTLSARKVTIIIGNALPLSIQILGHNLTSSIILGSNAAFDGDETAFSYTDDGESSGSLYLEITDSVNVTGYVEFYMLYMKTVNLVVDLPGGISGILQCLSIGSIQATADGWYYTEYPSGDSQYETPSSELPRLFFRASHVNTVIADLST